MGKHSLDISHSHLHSILSSFLIHAILCRIHFAHDILQRYATCELLFSTRKSVSYMCEQILVELPRLTMRGQIRDFSLFQRATILCTLLSFHLSREDSRLSNKTPQNLPSQSVGILRTWTPLILHDGHPSF